jgi:hypothetical protein
VHSVVGDGEVVDLIVEEIRIRISGTESNHKSNQTPTLPKCKHERLVRVPNSKHRVDMTPAKRVKDTTHHENEDKTPQQRHRAMTPDQVRSRLWAQRLEHVFNIDRSCASMHTRH